MPPDRRTFLRRAAAACLAGPAALSSACDAPGPEGDAPPGPDLLPAWVGSVQMSSSADDVHLLDPAGERPLAYLSRAERRIYVARHYRERAERRLAAYVSVTTGLWRIPLPGDDPRVPITPGDPLREYEEVDVEGWDPATLPSEGDARIRAGAPVGVRIDLACEPMVGDQAWLSAGPFRVERRDGPPGDGGREDFTSIGTGSRHVDGACRDAGQPVRVLAWACP